MYKFADIRTTFGHTIEISAKKVDGKVMIPDE